MTTPSSVTLMLIIMQLFKLGSNGNLREEEDRPVPTKPTSRYIRHYSHLTICIYPDVQAGDMNVLCVWLEFL